MNKEQRARLDRFCKRDVRLMTLAELDDYTALLRQYLAELEAWTKEKGA